MLSPELHPQPLCILWSCLGRLHTWIAAHMTIHWPQFDIQEEAILLLQITQSRAWSSNFPNSKVGVLFSVPSSQSVREEELGLRITCTQMPLIWEPVTGPSQISTMIPHAKEKESWVEQGHRQRLWDLAVAMKAERTKTIPRQTPSAPTLGKKISQLIWMLPKWLMKAFHLAQRGQNNPVFVQGV